MSIDNIIDLLTSHCSRCNSVTVYNSLPVNMKSALTLISPKITTSECIRYMLILGIWFMATLFLARKLYVHRDIPMKF